MTEEQTKEFRKNMKNYVRGLIHHNRLLMEEIELEKKDNLSSTIIELKKQGKL